MVPSSTSTFSEIWWPIFCTVLIIALILGLAWWLKQAGFNSSSPEFQKRFKLHTRCALGPREQLVVVQVDDHCLLLGVTAHTIQLLDRFEALPDASPASSKPASSFSALLDRLGYQKKEPL